MRPTTYFRRVLFLLGLQVYSTLVRLFGQSRLVLQSHLVLPCAQNGISTAQDAE